MHSDIFYSNLFFILIMVLTHKIDFIAQKETLTCSLKNAALKHKLTFKDKPSYYSCIKSQLGQCPTHNMCSGNIC